MTCARCNRDLESDSSYCRFCGAAVGERPPRPLRRIPSEGKLGGVCAGIAAYLDVDVTLVRLGWVALSIVPGVLIGGLIAYVLAWLFMPEGTPDPVTVIGKRLVRSNTNRMIAGVCSGVAEYLGIDRTIVRVVCVVLSIYPGAVIGGVIAYLIAWFVIPSAAEGPLTTASSPA
jgi:phage shock protein C